MTSGVESVVTFKWRPPKGYRSTFGPATVNVLRNMVARHYPKPHRFICVTDDPDGIDEGVEIVPLWSDYADLPSPHGPKYPSCYRRLRLFSREIDQLLGARFVSLDLDCVITGDLSPLWDRGEDFVIWGDTNPKTFYNGSMMLLTAGARPQVWERFDPRMSPRLTLREGFTGSDQGWISYCLGAGEAKWMKRDGVYSFRNHLKVGHDRSEPLPPDARIVFWHGELDPWSSRAQAIPWVQEHWR